MQSIAALPGKVTYFLVLTAAFDFALTKLDITVQREEDVASLQVSVDDVVVMEVDEGLQSLFTHHPDLRLCQRSLQFYRGQGSQKHILNIPDAGMNYGKLITGGNKLHSVYVCSLQGPLGV